MKTAAKVLCILALVIGLIWASVGFFSNWIGGAVSAGFKAGFLDDSTGATSTLYKAANSMIGHIAGFILVILAGVLGLVGTDKNPKKGKTLILGILTFVLGILLLVLGNYIAGVLYLIAGVLLFFAGITTKENITEKVEEAV
jgi:hypothetical protein